MKTYSLNRINVATQNRINTYGNIFGHLSESMLVEVYTPQESIIRFDNPISKLRFLIDGRAKITLTHENGKQSIVHFVHPGEYLGELTFLEIEKDHKNVYAISKCTFLSIDMLRAMKELKTDSKFLFKLCQFVGNKMLQRTYFHSKNQNYKLRNRLAAYILTTQCNGIFIEKHTETAEYLGVSYRHLLHTFKEFIETGLLIKMKKGYKINVSGLTLLAKDIILI